MTGTAGPFATATSIAETGAWGNYTLTGTVTEAGGTVAPTGTVSFLDASNGNSVLATGSLGAAVAGIGWSNPGALTNTEGTYFVLVADLNGDGIPDLMLESNPVSIYLEIVADFFVVGGNGFGDTTGCSSDEKTNARLPASADFGERTECG